MVQNFKKQIAVAIIGLFIAILLVVYFSSPSIEPSVNRNNSDPHQKGEHSETLSFNQISLSPRAQALAQVEVVPVERKQVQVEVRLFGKINYDESLLSHITAWIPGRIEKLYLNFTGISVSKGDHMVELYSPELLTAQEELLQSSKALNDLKDSPATYIKEQTGNNLESSRTKLRLWGIGDDQIHKIEETGEVKTTLTINAPMSGVVLKKEAVEGQYVKVGTKIYTIADLNEVWLELDAYESNLTWLRYAQDVEFTTDAHPGRTFHGKISFIDPFLNEKTRTAMVRVNVPNPKSLLKPGMYVRAIVRPTLTAHGKVQSPDLKGKWISPMHPHIVKDAPGVCPICGMDLIDAKSLGYTTNSNGKAHLPLTIPATAPLLTGKRAIVYIQSQKHNGVYEARQITLGPRTENSFIVHEGLEEGELVVVNGNFKIDSAAQILAKPSMMNPEGGSKPVMGHDHGH